LARHCRHAAQTHRRGDQAALYLDGIAERAAEPDTEASAKPFARPDAVAEQHRLTCTGCRATFEATGEPVDWDKCVEGAVVVSMAASGPMIDNM
jgi:hypothetical protein